MLYELQYYLQKFFLLLQLKLSQGLVFSRINPVFFEQQKSQYRVFYHDNRTLGGPVQDIPADLHTVECEARELVWI